MGTSSANLIVSSISLPPRKPQQQRAVFSEIPPLLADLADLADLASYSLIQSQFTSVHYNYTYFNPKLLNDSAAAVNASIALNAHDVSPFVIASLRAWNATGTEDPNDPASTPTPIPIPNGDNGSSSSNRFPMIALYVITGTVSLLFAIVIITGVSTCRHLALPHSYVNPGCASIPSSRALRTACL